MRHFEVSFIVDPVLSGDEVKSTAQTYQDMLTNEGARIIQVDEMGLRQLAYPINNRSSGLYFCIEFATENPTFIGKFELA
ncbi:MAG: 30S ribosomal protein S6 [Saprospiraceae bacterium]